MKKLIILISSLTGVLALTLACQSKMQEPNAGAVANQGVAEQRIKTQLQIDKRLDQISSYINTSEALIQSQAEPNSVNSTGPQKPVTAVDLFKKAIAQAKLEVAQEMINKMMVSGAFSFESPVVSPGCKTVLYQVIMPEDTEITELKLGVKTCNADDYIYIMKASFDAADSISFEVYPNEIGTVLKNITSVEKNNTQTN